MGRMREASGQICQAVLRGSRFGDVILCEEEDSQLLSHAAGFL